MTPRPEQVQIRLLGELRVSRDGVRQTLPPSKKTRALLGYLLLTGRSHRREALCTMFWDVADDPRGALRWSLSRLRPLLDSPGAPRLQATRDAVAIELLEAEVDVLSLRRAVLAAGDLERTPTEELERWAGTFAGELLEGLELPDFDEFQAFCLAQREELRRMRVRVLACLSARLAATPELALPYLRSWVTLDVLNLRARTQLLQLLQTSGRGEEALQHYRAARRVFEEHGSDELDALDRAWQQLRAVLSKPVSAAPIASVDDPWARPTRPSLLLPTGENEVIGRAPELSFLRDSLRAALRERRPKLVLLSGEAGIGKTHLLRYFAGWTRQRGFGVAWGEAHESERHRPYAALLGCLEHELAPALGAPAVAAQHADEPTSQRAESELCDAATNAIVAHARKVPALCLLIEDAHWIDRACADLLRHVLESRDQAPVLIVLSARSEELVDNPALTRLLRAGRRARRLEERVLAPLSERSLAALLEAEGDSLDTRRVIAQAGGNPLFALELARVGELRDEQLPESIAEAVRERVGRLRPEAAETLRWAALLDSRFSVQELARLANLDEEALVLGLEQLERAALLARDPGDESGAAPLYRFAHELVRRVVYAELSAPRRQWMHARAARALHVRADQSEAQLSQLMRHAALAHDHALAAEACVAAGTRCLRLFAYAEATLMARRGLKHCERLDGLERIRRSIELLEIELWCAARGQAVELTQRIRTLGDEAHAFGALAHARRAHKVLSYWHLAHEAFGSSEHHILMAELISRTAEPNEQLGSLAEAGRCMLLLGREQERAIGMLDDADSLAARLHLEPAVLRDGQGLLYQFRGDLEHAARRFEQAAALASVERNRLIEFQAIEHRTLLEFDRGDFAAAARYCGPLLEVARGLPDGSELALAEAIRAMTAYAVDPARAEDVERWFVQLRGLGAHRRLLHASAKRAELELMHGRLEQARACARETLALAERLARPNERYLALALLAHIAQQTGDRAEQQASLARLAEVRESEVEQGALQRMRTWSVAERAARLAQPAC